MRFIGDVHGKFNKYLQLIDGVERSIQVGDMGLGFGEKFPTKKVVGWHLFIRGNHDNPNSCHQNPRWIPDGSSFTVEGSKFFFLGGAWSIDWEWRQNYEMSTGRKIWWPNEECSVPKLQKIIDYYVECKPKIVVTHDCPLVMAEQLNSQYQWDKSKTRQALDSMFEIHHPDIWIFGHHHISTIADIAGTRFFALNELAYVDVEIGGSLIHGEIK